METDKADKVGLVINRGAIGKLKASGLELGERWSRALRVNGYTSRDTEESMVRSVLCEASSFVLVVDEAAVFDDESLARIAKTECNENEIVGFEGDELTVSPAILMGAGAARAVGKLENIVWRDFSEVFDALSKVEDLSVRKEKIERMIFGEVTDQRSAREITWKLLWGLRYRYGGLVAKWLNRPVSLNLTRFLLPLPISPNLVTTIAGVLGLVAVWALLQGGYVWGIIGCGIMHMSSILDGNDGEIARMKYLASKFGKWYDSVWDEVVDALYLAAIGYNLYLNFDFFYFVPMGIFAGSVSFVYACVNWHSKVRYGVGMYWWFDSVGTQALTYRAPSLRTQWKTLFGRDAYILAALLLAALNLLPVLLVAISGASVAIFSLLFIHIVIKRAKW